MERKEFIEKNIDNMINDLGSMVACASVWDPDTAGEGRPFGRGPREALDKFCEIARRMGFQTKDFDGYAAEINVGAGEKMVGILGHIDVVPAGDGWDTEPFVMTRIGDNLYGRGTLDDKGPMVSCLYAMKYLSENGLIPDGCSIRMIAGTDEEENHQCIKYYLKHADRMPDCSIIPDAYFPLVNSEKGLVDFDSEFKFEPAADADAEVLEFSVGNARNIVPAKAHCRIKPAVGKEKKVLEMLQGTEDLAVEKTDEGILVKASGFATHAMAPENGKNAAGMLITRLKESGLVFTIQPFIDAYAENIGMEFNGEHMDCCWEDEESGKLTMNFGQMELKDDTIFIKANVRYPVSFSHEDLMEHFVAHMKQAGFTYKETLAMDPMLVEKDSAFIHLLMDSYREVTGDMEHEPFSIGGATYARYLPTAVSFGPLFTDEVELAHEPNEFIPVDSFRKFTEIYMIALEKLLDYSMFEH